MSYPDRKGKMITAWNGIEFDSLEYNRCERINPTSVKELESFLQTWLYFGLLFEIGAGFHASIAEGQSETPAPDLMEFLDKMYDDMVFQEGNDSFVKLSSEYLDSFFEKALSQVSQDAPATTKRRYFDHIILCLTYAHPMITASVPKTFNHAVRYSIAALGELITYAMNFLANRFEIPMTFGRSWSNGFFNEEMRRSMRDHGWCPSDIARTENKYNSIQTLYTARMLDKSQPPRDHSRCTDSGCKLYQIDMHAGKYEVGHQLEGCSCDLLEVSSEELTKILKKGDRYPLLRLKGNLDNLTAELVECTEDTPYVAISHVWADGLGNPHANSLHRCKLIHLRELVSALGTGDASNSEAIPLIWLDTLCCPAENGEGKQAAIEKIRLVYRAKHVLVLDSGLMAYDAQPQDVSEQATRIFTSSWMRRLWTLQEGALAQSLYFQFADKAVDIQGLINAFFQIYTSGSMRHRAAWQDTWKETQGLLAFFNKDLAPTLSILDESLKYRSVSVSTDEPLCIGTLMSLDLPSILNVKPEGDRMKKAWELMAAKVGGIPSQVIFFEETRIDSPGWRWAPQTLLEMKKGIHDFSSRMLRWSDRQLGAITPWGLRVQYPGYRLYTIKHDDDGRPQNPWPGFKRIPEAYIEFRDVDTGNWFRIFDKGIAFISQHETEEERKAHDKLGLFPLHDVVNTDKSVMIMNSVGGAWEAVFATVTDEGKPAEDGIPVTTQRFIGIQSMLPDDGYIYTTIRRVALELRTDPMTDQHLELYNRLSQELGESGSGSETLVENEELKASIKGLKEKMKAMMKDVVDNDQRFVAGVTTNFGPDFLATIWVLIYEFFHHDYVGEKIEPEQVWYVD